MLFCVKEPIYSDLENTGIQLYTSDPGFKKNDLLILKFGEKRVSAGVINVRQDVENHILLSKWQRNALGVKLDEDVEIIRCDKNECPLAEEITLGVSSKILGVSEKETVAKCIHQGLLNKPVLIGEQKRIPFYLDAENPETDIEVMNTVPSDSIVLVTNKTSCKIELSPMTFIIKRIKELVLSLEADIPWEKRKEIFAELDELVTQYDAIDAENRKLRADTEKLKNPPLHHGIVIGRSTVDNHHVTIGVGGQKYDVAVDEGIELEKLEEGNEVLLNEVRNIVAIYGLERKGETAEIINILKTLKIGDDGTEAEIPERLHVRIGGADMVVQTGEKLMVEGVEIGDMIRVDPHLKIAFEKLPAHETGLELEEVPDISYDDIGGLKHVIGLIREAIDIPYLHVEKYKQFKLERPKGILLYGPPGCGKTMIAKAIANGLAATIREYIKDKRDDSLPEKNVQSYFINIKGPELLDKYVGETEYKIRKIFERAKLKASFHTPVILFFDEMEAMFRKRGSGKSSDVETTIVPQFLSMMDGVEEFSHIVIIGATNRPDMLDPAVKRPGRLDIKIKIDRPNREEAKDIFKKYLLAANEERTAIPLATQEMEGKTREDAVSNIVEHALEIIFDTNNFLEVSSSKGRVETFPLKNFISGAIIRSIISRAAKRAVREIINRQRPDDGGLAVIDMEEAVKEEFVQNRDHLLENLPEMEGQDIEISIHIGKEKTLDKWDIPKERPYPGTRRER